MPTGNRRDFLRDVPLFNGMDAAELAQLAADLKRRYFAADQTVFYQGDPGSAVYIIVSGRVRIYVHGEEGQEVSVVIYGPGDLFGEMALLDRQPRSATAVAMEDTVLLTLSDDDFYRHLRQSHQLALNLMLTLSTRLRDTTEAVESLATLNVNRRLIKRLLYLAERHGVVTEEGIRIRGRLTQQALASLISTSRESTNRALRALACKGLIDVRHGRITLLKPQELERLVTGEDSQV
jgi:CRP/FNR family transcriptional regulator/CRP/FNR family cyclic AMP-dependent transcriptional regulator